MKKGNSQILPVVIIALIIPLLITIMWVVNVSTTHSVEGSLTDSVTDETLATQANNTEFSLGHTYPYKDVGLTFNASNLVENVNYSVNWVSGKVKWIGHVGSNENSSVYLVDYQYFPDDERETFMTIRSNTGDSYDMAGILPIALIGIAVLSMIVGAIGGFMYLQR